MAKGDQGVFHIPTVHQEADLLACKYLRYRSEEESDNIELAGVPSVRNNQEALKTRMGYLVLPKKGRLSKVNKARESSPRFVELRKQHLTVEFAINALEVSKHMGWANVEITAYGFKRYIAMAVVARNIPRLGSVLRQQEQEAAQRRRGPYKKVA